MKECTCYKAHIYGRCDYCKEWDMSELMKEVRDLIKKYPLEVDQLIEPQWEKHIR